MAKYIFILYLASLVLLGVTLNNYSINKYLHFLILINYGLIIGIIIQKIHNAEKNEENKKK